jgi:hypothetical protein
MSQDVAYERVDDIWVALRLDFDDVVAYVAHEAINVVMRCNPAHRFTKENALHATPYLDVSTLAHGRRFCVSPVRPWPAARGLPSRAKYVLLITTSRCGEGLKWNVAAPCPLGRRSAS